MKSEFIVHERSYYCYLDEKHFYEWLQSIDGVREIVGTADGLVIRLLSPGLNQNGLYDLIGLLTRYGYNAGVVRDLVRPEDEKWFRDPLMYWHSDVFGET